MEKKYGVKVSIIETIEYPEFKEILEAIQRLGYTVTMVDNGNAVCEKTKT